MRVVVRVHYGGWLVAGEVCADLRSGVHNPLPSSFATSLLASRVRTCSENARVTPPSIYAVCRVCLRYLTTVSRMKVTVGGRVSAGSGFPDLREKPPDYKVSNHCCTKIVVIVSARHDSRRSTTPDAQHFLGGPSCGPQRTF